MAVVTLCYTEALIRRAVGRFWWRTTGWTFVAAMMLVLVPLVLLVTAGDRSSLMVFLAIALAAGITFAVALIVVHDRGWLRRFRRMRTPVAMLALHEERLCMSSDVGTRELPWSAVTEVWLFPECLLIFLSRAVFLIVPIKSADSTVVQFIVDKARSHGARVT